MERVDLTGEWELIGRPLGDGPEAAAAVLRADPDFPLPAAAPAEAGRGYPERGGAAADLSAQARLCAGLGLESAASHMRDDRSGRVLLELALG